MAVSLDDVLQQLQWRYATKKFDASKKIPESTWRVLEQSLVLAPSSFGLQPWKFFVVTDPELRQELVNHSWGQKQVVDASHLVVLAIKKGINTEDVDRYLARQAAVHQVPIENLQKYGDVVKGFLEKPPYPLDMDDWSTRQVYLALGQLMTAAAMLGIDTCPMEGFNPAKYDELLGLPTQGYKSVVVCTLGYRADDDKYASLPKVRYETEEVISYL
ncbi:nitroreductase family protein [Candidatus Synechococcus calcipolaris G9]|uniref:Nitroreductase family protein n=1 Tax=Candidatus Synechococcus calcipolaris G9 TaxID=1497997 RepID=A0ABT6F1U8_9SYNE|nr:nitroreductase family protein [Candidatus Synechococcus calcipolaris]MDG2991826.1 nitroreductase family protein [Candidatus Synechococcus calcipolaris G9]